MTITEEQAQTAFSHEFNPRYLDIFRNSIAWFPLPATALAIGATTGLP